MKRLIQFVFLLLMIPVGSCEKDHPCDNVYTTRVGAICMDGSKTDATGSGACSNHGGVNYWVCK